MKYIRTVSKDARFKRRVAERMKTRIRLICDGDRPIGRDKYKIWQLISWGRM